MAAALAAGALVCAGCVPAAAASAPGTSVTLAIVPRTTTIADLAEVPGMSLGLMSAGIAQVPSEQTFLASRRAGGSTMRSTTAARPGSSRSRERFRAGPM